MSESNSASSEEEEEEEEEDLDERLSSANSSEDEQPTSEELPDPQNPAEDSLRPSRDASNTSSSQDEPSSLTESVKLHLQFEIRAKLDSGWYTDGTAFSKGDAPPDTLEFLEETGKDEWTAFVKRAEEQTETKKYFKKKWSIAELESLRRSMGPMDAMMEWTFVYQLVVIHLRQLRAMGTCNAFLPITQCFDMGSLVSNVAHLLKYRKCVTTAKKLYKATQSATLHERYRAKLLNMELAHHHQDESDTVLGISRRMIRQAHVSNWVHDKYSSFTAPKKSNYANEPYSAESHFTNPPMSPMMCSAPPNMDTLALSLLMASFASKLGADVEFGSSPSRSFTKPDLLSKLSKLQWNAQQMPDIHIYSPEYGPSDLLKMNERIHDIANYVNKWVFHIRYEAHHLLKPQSNTLDSLRASYPNFYGMNMCVSATLIGVHSEGELCGSTDSVVGLLHGKKTTRSALEKVVIMQPWSFPVTCDVLIPSRSSFPEINEEGEDDAWYSSFYYDPRSELKQYKGLWLDSVGWQVPGMESDLDKNLLLTSEYGIRIDGLMDTLFQKHKLVLCGNEIKSGTRALYDVETVYTKLLSDFNFENKLYFSKMYGWQECPYTRICTRPLTGITKDASLFLAQVQDWLEADDVVTVAGGKIMHPVLVAAPSDDSSSSRDWAVLICKMAWIRFHKDYSAGLITEEYSSASVAKRYGVTVITERINDADLVGIVAKLEDVHQAPLELYTVFTFDPRLAENRLPEHNLKNESVGRMLHHVLLPVLSPKELKQYTDDLQYGMSDAEPQTAVDFVNAQASSRKCYTFHENLSYKVQENSDDLDGGSDVCVREYEKETALNQEFARESAERDRAAAAAEAASATRIPVRPNTFMISSDSDDDDDDDDTEDVEKDMDILKAAPGREKFPQFKDGVPMITNVNAIALRICVTSRKTAQLAIADSLHKCNIKHIASLNCNILDSGTAPIVVKNSKTHVFVPEYCCVSNGLKRSMAELYHMIGRGFYDLVDARLNSSLKILASDTTIGILFEYGKYELLMTMIKQESLTGRLLTLGSILTQTDMCRSNISNLQLGWTRNVTLNDIFYNYHGCKRPITNSTMWELRNQLLNNDSIILTEEQMENNITEKVFTIEDGIASLSNAL